MQDENPVKRSRKKSQNAQPDDAPDTVGGRIRRRLVERGLSQSDLARKTGIERTDINRIINDRRRPRPDQLTWIATALVVEERDLLGEELPADLEKTRAELAKLAERILQVESERQTAQRATHAAEVRLESERKAFTQHRATLEKALEAERTRRRTVEEEREVERCRHESEAQLNESNVADLKRQIGELAQRNALLEADNASLRQAFAKEKAAHVGTGTLAGLAGLFAGAMLADNGGGRRRSR